MTRLLLDTSVWIDYLRDAPTPTTALVERLVHEGADLVTTEPVVMELLAGGDTPARAAALEQLVNGLPVLSVDPRIDFRSAASLYLTARSTGRTPRTLVDCLIAAVAVRHEVVLAHNDADFDAIEACSPLRTRPLR